jgi:hypothetical protein
MCRSHPPFQGEPILRQASQPVSTGLSACPTPARKQPTQGSPRTPGLGWSPLEPSRATAWRSPAAGRRPPARHAVHLQDQGGQHGCPRDQEAEAGTRQDAGTARPRPRRGQGGPGRHVPAQQRCREWNTHEREVPGARSRQLPRVGGERTQRLDPSEGGRVATCPYETSTRNRTRRHDGPPTQDPIAARRPDTGSAAPAR